MFVWQNTGRSRPRNVACPPLPFSTPLSFRRSVLWCSGLFMFKQFLKPLSTSALPNRRPDVMFAVLASLSALSFPLPQACPAGAVHPQKSVQPKPVHGCAPTGAAHPRLRVRLWLVYPMRKIWAIGSEQNIRYEYSRCDFNFTQLILGNCLETQIKRTLTHWCANSPQLSYIRLNEYNSRTKNTDRFHIDNAIQWVRCHE